MSIHRSHYARGLNQAPYPQIAGDSVVHRFAMDVPITVVAGDILEVATIPPHTEPMDMTIDVDSLDTGVALLLDVGVMSGPVGSEDTGRTCGNEFFNDSTIGRAGGVVRTDNVDAFRIGASNVARSVGVKILTPASNPQEGTIGITLTVAAT